MENHVTYIEQQIAAGIQSCTIVTHWQFFFNTQAFGKKQATDSNRSSLCNSDLCLILDTAQFVLLQGSGTELLAFATLHLKPLHQHKAEAIPAYRHRSFARARNQHPNHKIGDVAVEARTYFVYLCLV